MKYIRKFNEDVNNDNYDDIKETVKNNNRCVLLLFSFL